MSGQSSERCAIRNVIAYALISGGPAAISPFLALWLQSRQVPIAQIGLVVAAPLFGRLLFSPILIVWSRRFRHLCTPAALLCCLAALFSFFLLTIEQAAFQIVAWVLLLTCIGACIQLLDVVTVRDAAKRNFSFSVTRSAGPIAYVFGGVIVGEAMALHGAAAVPIWAGATAILSAAGFYLLIKAETVSPGNPSKSVERPNTKYPILVLLAIATNGFIELSHGFHSIATIFWHERGYDQFWCGLLWQTGAAADIFFLWALARWRPAPTFLLVVGGSASVIRWAVCAFSPALPTLFFLQALHALSVTACMVATLQLIETLYDASDSLPWQVLNWGFATGFCNGIGRIGSGFIYRWIGFNGYWLMCGLAGVGLVLGVILHIRMSDWANNNYRKQARCSTDDAAPVAAANVVTSAQTI